MNAPLCPALFRFVTDTENEAIITMFSLHPTTSPLPQNAAVHVRLRWRRGLLGLPLPAPAVKVDTRRPRS